MMLKCSALLTWRLPWNMKCSNRCAKPVRPGVSWREPTTYQMLIATTGARWSGATITRSPLGNWRWLKWIVGRSSWGWTLVDVSGTRPIVAHPARGAAGGGVPEVSERNRVLGLHWVAHPPHPTSYAFLGD